MTSTSQPGHSQRRQITKTHDRSWCNVPFAPFPTHPSTSFDRNTCCSPPRSHILCSLRCAGVRSHMISVMIFGGRSASTSHFSRRKTNGSTCMIVCGCRIDRERSRLSPFWSCSTKSSDTPDAEKFPSIFVLGCTSANTPEQFLERRLPHQRAMDIPVQHRATGYLENSL